MAERNPVRGMSGGRPQVSGPAIGIGARGHFETRPDRLVPTVGFAAVRASHERDLEPADGTAGSEFSASSHGLRCPTGTWHNPCLISHRDAERQS